MHQTRNLAHKPSRQKFKPTARPSRVNRRSITQNQRSHIKSTRKFATTAWSLNPPAIISQKLTPNEIQEKLQQVPQWALVCYHSNIFLTFIRIIMSSIIVHAIHYAHSPPKCPHFLNCFFLGGCFVFFSFS